MPGVVSRWLGTILLFGILSGATHAQTNLDASAWLQRMVSATQRLSYSGTFVYRSHDREETSRITHIAGPTGVIERIESLEGSPREIIRANDELTCYLPKEKLLIKQRSASSGVFPAVLPESMASITEFYTLRKGEVGRVAGLESQQLILEPRDAFRYGYQFWVEMTTGLLLKARTMGDAKNILESVAFTQIHLGQTPDPSLVRSAYSGKTSGWRVQHVQATEQRPGDDRLSFSSGVPGFRQMAGLRRHIHKDGPGTLQTVFSDGLAAVSVFVEPLSARAERDSGAARYGAIRIYQRIVADHLVTVVGEAPMATLQRIGDGVELRK